MGVLEKFEPAVYAPLCMTSIMTLAVSLEVVYVILTDPHLAPAPSVDRTSSSLEPEPWGTPRTMASPGRPLGMWQITHLTFIAFVLGNVLGNLCLFITRSPSIRGVFLANQAVGQGWSYCFLCESHVPPRCSHCPDCKVCVLRRDHHCVLFGQCVGHANHRFFLCCLLHMWLGLLYAISLNADIFLGFLQEGLSLHSLFLLLIPWAMLITGHVGVHTFVFAFMADTCILGFLFVSAFLLFHLRLLWHGQTTREWSAGLRGLYDLGWRRNAVELLGCRWYLAWLCPLVPSPLPGNGVTFEIRPLPAHQPAYVLRDLPNPTADDVDLTSFSVPLHDLRSSGRGRTDSRPMASRGNCHPLVVPGHHSALHGPGRLDDFREPALLPPPPQEIS